MLNPELETKGIESEEPDSALGKILMKMQAINKGREKVYVIVFMLQVFQMQ